MWVQEEPDRLLTRCLRLSYAKISMAHNADIEKTSSRVRVDGQMSEKFTLKRGVVQEDGFTPMLFNLALEKQCVKFQATQETQFSTVNLSV